MKFTLFKNKTMSIVYSRIKVETKMEEMNMPYCIFKYIFEVSVADLVGLYNTFI